MVSQGNAGASSAAPPLRYAGGVSPLETSAVTLAPLQLDDVEAMAEMTERNRDDLAGVSPSEAGAEGVDGMRRRVERVLAEVETGQRVYWTIRVDGVIAGDIVLSHIQRGALQRANLGYMVDSRHRGRGVATAAARLAVERAFGEVGLHRVEAGTKLDNVASQRVLERVGFTRVGVQRALLRIGDRWEDHYLYELVGPDTAPHGRRGDGGGGVAGIDHVQLAMPAGGEQRAVAFYAGVLGLGQVAKPASLAARGGCWFQRGTARIHLGVEDGFRAARKAHPALLVHDLAALTARLREAGAAVDDGEPLEGFDRAYVDDPFGNRIELLEPVAAH